jgi:23S rRNA pseudouridine1911/1915/1917 synthase
MSSEEIHVNLRERVRLDVYLTRHLAHVSRNRVQRHIHAGDVLVDGQTVRPNHVLVGGEIIRLPTFEARQLERASEPVQFEIVYEDADLAVVDKPAGLLMHPVGREFQRTLLNGMYHRMRDRGDDPTAMGIVHRLDRLTSGLVVLAKTLEARRLLSFDVEHRRVNRDYLAVVTGAPAAQRGVIDLYIGRDPARPTRMQALHAEDVPHALRTIVRPQVSESGYSDPRLDLRPRPARTHWRVLRRLRGATLLGFRLETGRTHQIRVHSQAAGWPLLGDPLYGPKGILPETSLGRAEQTLARPALHAARLEFTHPGTRIRMHFRARMPDDMRIAIAALA